MSIQKNITLIGCGRWGLNILRDLVFLNSRVIVIDPNLQAQKLALQAGAIAVYSNITIYFIDNFLTDAYIIAASCKQHYALLLALKDHTQPIFIEKPMVLTLHEAIHIQSLMGPRVFIMHKWRYHPGIMAIKKLIQNKTLGDLKYITTIRHGIQFDYDIPGYLILLPHDLSIILELLNKIPKVKQVIPYLREHQLLGFKATFDGNPKISIDICSSNTNFKREIIATFTNGKAVLSEENYKYISLFNNDGDWVGNIILENVQPLYKELQTFIFYLTGDRPPKSKIEDEIKIIECTEALLRAINKYHNLELVEHDQFGTI